VLGLRHRTGHGCSLMTERAFESACAPSRRGSEPSSSELACVPAPTDVKAAARLYGGAPSFEDPRCK
jgi:hypothetical protein